MNWYILRLLSLRFAATVVLTASVWFTLWFYDWSASNLGPNYAIAYAWISSGTSIGLLVFVVGRWVSTPQAPPVRRSTVELLPVKTSKEKPAFAPYPKCHDCGHVWKRTGVFTEGRTSEIARCGEPNCPCAETLFGCRLLDPLDDSKSPTPTLLSSSGVTECPTCEHPVKGTEQITFDKKLRYAKCGVPECFCTKNRNHCTFINNTEPS